MSWIAIIGLAVVGFAALALAQRALVPPDLGTVISPADAHAQALNGQVVLVDVRTPQEWRETGVPASAHAITMHQDSNAFLQAISSVTGGDKAKPLALICRTGNRTTALQAQMKAIGFTSVINVAEGVVGGRYGAGWLKTGLPMRPGNAATNPPVLASQ